MKKEEIYVVIDSEEKRLRAIQILSDAGEILINNSSLSKRYNTEMELKFTFDYWWVTNNYNNNKQEITLDQLEQLLLPKQGYICPQTKIQCDDECCVSAEDCHITSSLASGMVDCDELKQEWQQERMYSEEEVLDLLYKLWEANPRNIKDWFEQFKKK